MQAALQCDLNKRERTGTNHRVICDYGGTFINPDRASAPLFHMGVAFITSEIQWYSPLTRNERLARVSVPRGYIYIYSWRLFPLNVKQTSHSMTRFSAYILSRRAVPRTRTTGKIALQKKTHTKAASLVSHNMNDTQNPRGSQHEPSAHRIRTS